MECYFPNFVALLWGVQLFFVSLEPSVHHPGIRNSEMIDIVTRASCNNISSASSRVSGSNYMYAVIGPALLITHHCINTLTIGEQFGVRKIHRFLNTGSAEIAPSRHHQSGVDNVYRNYWHGHMAHKL